MTRLLVIIAVAFVLVSAVFGWMLRTYLPGATVTDILFEMTLSLDLLALLILLTMVFGAVGGFKRDIASVHVATILTVAFGVLGAVAGEYNTHFGVLFDNVVTFATLAPLRLESLAMLALGLFGALPGLSILHLQGGVRRD